jgi:hypothetical protein
MAKPRNPKPQDNPEGEAPVNAVPQGLGEPQPETDREPKETDLGNGITRVDY